MCVGLMMDSLPPFSSPCESPFHSISEGIPMRERNSLLLAVLLAVGGTAHATNYTVTIDAQNLQYVPASLQLVRGDSVTIEASSFHPLFFMDNPGVTCTAACTFKFNSASSPFDFFCGNHVAQGMAGSVNVLDNPDFLYGDDFEVPLQPAQG
jgi:plastocyanin